MKKEIRKKKDSLALSLEQKGLRMGEKGLYFLDSDEKTTVT